MTASQPDGLLALDVATTTGWAFGRPGERPQFGHFHAGTPRRAGRPPAESGEVFALFAAWLNRCCDEWRPGWIAFESPYVPRVVPPKVRAANGARIATLPAATAPIDIKVLRRLISMCGLVEMVAHERGIPCREEASNVICRQFTGRGSWGSRAEKKLATQKMAAVYGWSETTEDEADALALWVYAEAVLDPKAGIRRGSGPLFARGVS